MRELKTELKRELKSKLKREGLKRELNLRVSLINHKAFPKRGFTFS